MLQLVNNFIEKRVRNRPENLLIDSMIVQYDHSTEEIKRLVAELKKTQLKALRYATMLENVIDAMPGIVWGKDLNGKFFLTNIKLREALLGGISVDEALAFSAESAAQLAGVEHNTLYVECAKTDLIVLDNLKPMTFVERGLVNGKWQVYRTAKAPYYSCDGELQGTVGFGRNITDDCEIVINSLKSIDAAANLCEKRCEGSVIMLDTLYKISDVIHEQYDDVCKEPTDV